MRSRETGQSINITSYRNFGNLEKARNFFRQNKFALLTNFLDANAVNNWAKVCKELLTKYGINIERKVSRKRLSYTVVTGEVIRRHAAEIYRFYRGRTMRNLTRRITDAREIYVRFAAVSNLAVLLYVERA